MPGFAALDILTEITDTVNHLRFGVNILARHGSTHVASAALLLATGFERLMKIALILELELLKQAKDQDFFRKLLGHDLSKCFYQITSRKLWTKADSAPPIWMDSRVVEFVAILKLHSGTGRYATFDNIFVRDVTCRTPIDRLDHYLTRVGLDRDEFSASFGLFDDVGEEMVSQRLLREARAKGLAVIQSLARAVCRIFANGKIREVSLPFIPALCPFLELRDEDLTKPATLLEPWSGIFDGPAADSLLI